MHPAGEKAIITLLSLGYSLSNLYSQSGFDHDFYEFIVEKKLLPYAKTLKKPDNDTVKFEVPAVGVPTRFNRYPLEVEIGYRDNEPLSVRIQIKPNNIGWIDSLQTKSTPDSTFKLNERVNKPIGGIHQYRNEYINQVNRVMDFSLNKMKKLRQNRPRSKI